MTCEDFQLARDIAEAPNVSSSSRENYTSIKKIGIEAVIKNEPGRILFGQTVPHREFTGIVLLANSPGEDLKGFFHSSQIHSKENNFSGRNTMGWKNAKLDLVLEKIETEFDPKKQITLAQKAVEYYIEDLPSIALFYRSTNAVTTKDLKNFFLSLQSDETNEAEYWEL